MNLFRQSANAKLWVAIAVLGLMVVGTPIGLVAWARTPYATGQQELVVQPVKFDHRHHAGDANIDCSYCHDGARRAPYAGIPATSVCMGCHSQVWTQSPELAPVRASWFDGTPIHWKRVNALPDHVFFDHSAHAAKGIHCEKCHGDVRNMAQVRQVMPLTMEWCVDCHRENSVHEGDRCSTCHR